MDGIYQRLTPSFACSFLFLLLLTGCGMSTEVPVDEEDPGITGDVMISDLRVSGITDTTATVTWATDRATVGTVALDTQPDLLTTQTSVSGLSYNHEVLLQSLIPNTRYYYEVSALSSQGDTASTKGAPFQTAHDSDLMDITAPVISDFHVSGVTSSSAEIRWRTDDRTRGVVQWDPDGVAPLDSTSIEYEGDTGKYTRGHSMVLMGLEDGTTYASAVEVANKVGLETTSYQIQFTTLASPAITFCDAPYTAMEDQEFTASICIQQASNLHAAAIVFLWERQKLSVPGRTQAIQASNDFYSVQDGHMFMVSELPEDVQLPAEWDGLVIEVTWEVEFDQSGEGALGTSADGNLEVALIDVKLKIAETEGLLRIADITDLYDHNHLPVSFDTEDGQVIVAP